LRAGRSEITLGTMQEAPAADPLAALVSWHAEAARASARDPDAMTLATATPEGRPSARIVLFKGLADGKIQFVTHYTSRKGREIEHNPEVALVFYWPELMRQIRIEGRAARASALESDRYFQSRPRASQLSAWASAQSEPVASREVLEQRFALAEARFQGRDVERPSEWGLYQVEPRAIELWVSGANRMHDRFSYTRAGAGWSLARLCP
jgi:pyridoxamine 5'-phosphate oxidase